MILSDFNHVTILACGEDQRHQSFQQAMQHVESAGGSVVRIQRTEGVSTTSLRTLMAGPPASQQPA